MLEPKSKNEGCAVIIGFVVVFCLVLGLALFFSGGKEAAGPAGAPKQRFRAQPGTTRDRAMALTTKKAAPDLKQEQPDASQAMPDAPPPNASRKRNIRALSLSRSEEQEKELTEAQQKVREALNTFSPEQGIAQLEEALKTAVAPADKSEMHRALAKLYAQKTPPDIVKSEKALDLALTHAPSQKDRDAIVLDQTQLYLQRGEPALAQTRLAAALSEPGRSGTASMRLNMALSQSQEAAGLLDEAAKGYAALAEAAVQMKTEAPESKAEADELMRLSIMRLTRLYREKGMHEEAERIMAAFEHDLAVAP